MRGVLTKLCTKVDENRVTMRLKPLTLWTELRKLGLLSMIAPSSGPASQRDLHFDDDLAETR